MTVVEDIIKREGNKYTVFFDVDLASYVRVGIYILLFYNRHCTALEGPDAIRCKAKLLEYSHKSFSI